MGDRYCIVMRGKTWTMSWNGEAFTNRRNEAVLFHSVRLAELAIGKLFPVYEVEDAEARKLIYSEAW